MGDGDPEFSISLMEKFLSCSLENDDVKDAYLFYNRGVCAALKNDNIVALLQRLEKEGATIYFCGACLDYYELGAALKVGKICCMNDIRETLNITKADFL